MGPVRRDIDHFCVFARVCLRSYFRSDVERENVPVTEVEDPSTVLRDASESRKVGGYFLGSGVIDPRVELAGDLERNNISIVRRTSVFCVFPRLRRLVSRKQ